MKMQDEDAGESVGRYAQGKRMHRPYIPMYRVYLTYLPVTCTCVGKRLSTRKALESPSSLDSLASKKTTTKRPQTPSPYLPTVKYPVPAVYGAKT